LGYHRDVGVRAAFELFYMFQDANIAENMSGNVEKGWLFERFLAKRAKRVSRVRFRGSWERKGGGNNTFDPLNGVVAASGGRKVPLRRF
jgi:hypothetical protein